MSSFTVCSFNIGTDESDFLNTYNVYREKKDPSLPEATRTDFSFDQPFMGKYAEVQAQTSKLMLKKAAHVYCLQEISNLDRAILGFVKGKHFECISTPLLKRPDAALFLDTRRFKEITNCSFMDPQGNNVAVAVATDVKTGQKVAFASAHVPGFRLSDIKNPDATSLGLAHCQEIAKKLSELAPCALHIIGADMNANPKELSDRFNTFTGFKIFQTNKPTNVNQEEPNYRELDYFFVKTIAKTTFSFWTALQSLFFSSFDQYIARVCTDQPLKEFNPHKLASDHRSIFMTVTPQFHAPLWRRCISWLFGQP